MIKKLTTKNFRKLTDHTFNFSGGLQVVRGTNEAGKSTMLEAIAYALSGAKACREALAQVVTWGNPEKTLKVELVIEIDGVDYTIARSKAGAEINYAGGKVVGQNECTQFIETLIGAPAGMIGNLMLASQGAIRGALEEGSAATMQLIEKLADFAVLDTVIDLIQTRRTTGPTATQEDRVKRAYDAKVAAAAAVVQVDVGAQQAALTAGQARISAARTKLDGGVAEAFRKAQAAVDQAERQAAQRDTLVTQHARAVQTTTAQENQLAGAQSMAGLPVKAEEFDAVRQAIAEQEAGAARMQAYDRVKTMAMPETFWEGDEASLAAEIARVQGCLNTVNAEIAETFAGIKLAIKSRDAGDTCAACGQKFANAAEIAKHKAEAVAVLKDLDARQKTRTDQRSELEAELAALKAVQKQGETFERAAAQLSQYVTVDRSTVPCKISMEKPEFDGARLQALKRQLAELNQRHDTANRAAGQIATLKQSIASSKADEQALLDQIKSLTEAEKLGEYQTALAKLEEEYNQLMNEIVEAEQSVSVAQATIDAAQKNHDAQMAALQAAQDQVTREEAELKAIEFNNHLLKRVRAARPVIADKLWTIVLAAVSGYFSAMRGTKSVVSRKSNTFLVDGESIGGLSGSTLDILGLAIRLALTRTFLPNSPFLILDEPAAACDDDRAGSMLGFLVSAGFPQTLLVTHEEMSESIASNLITI